MRAALSVIMVVVPCAAQSFLSGGLTRFAGIDTSNLTGDNGPAYYAAFQGPYAVARDAAGNIYIGEIARIRRIDLHGIITTIAGTGVAGESGDGGLATSAQINYVGGIAIGSTGNLYFSEDQARIRRIAPDGIISTFAVESGPAGLAVDSENRLYVAEPNNAAVRVIGQDGTVSTFAGNGTVGYGGEGGPALQAQLTQPRDLAFDTAGNLYIADGQRVAKIDTYGLLSRIAGDPSLPLGSPSQDEIPATQSSLTAFSVATDPAGDVFVATPRVRKITPDGIIHAFAGVEESTPLAFTEACGQALKATVRAAGMKADANGNVFFINQLANRLEEATPAGMISTLAGAGPNLFTGDGGPASAATFASPNAIAFDKQGNLYVADTNNNRIRRIDASGMVSTVVGDGGPVYNQDPACSPDQDKFLRNPQGVAVDAAGNIFIADTGKNRVLKIAQDGTQSTIGGLFSKPQGVLPGGAGNVFVTDSGNSALKKIGSSGNIQILWTGGAAGSMAFDAAGDLFFPALYTVQRRSVTGVISPVAGTGEFTFAAAPGFVSGVEEVGDAQAVAIDSEGSIYVADAGKGVIERISHNCALSVDGGATLRQPTGLAFDTRSNLYIADAAQGTIWVGTPTTPPANEAPTPYFGRTGIQSAAPANLVTPMGEPPAPPLGAPIAPGELLRIRGVCMGPFEPVSVGFGGNGALALSAGGTQILFNNTPAPLISVSSGEIIAQAPFELDGLSAAPVALTYNSIAIQASITVQAANPAVFTMNSEPSGPALALNQDGTLNSAANPAPVGSIVVLYATGTGQTLPPGLDGTAPLSTDLPHPELPVLVTIASENAGLLYAGDAPGFVGLTQLNVRVPTSIVGGGAQPITLEVGGFPLNQSNVTVYVSP